MKRIWVTSSVPQLFNPGSHVHNSTLQTVQNVQRQQVFVHAAGGMLGWGAVDFIERQVS